MKNVEKYGLPLLTSYGWKVVSRTMLVIGLAGLAAIFAGAQM